DLRARVVRLSRGGMAPEAQPRQPSARRPGRCVAVRLAIAPAIASAAAQVGAEIALPDLRGLRQLRLVVPMCRIGEIDGFVAAHAPVVAGEDASGQMAQPIPRAHPPVSPWLSGGGRDPRTDRAM